MLCEYYSIKWDSTVLRMEEDNTVKTLLNTENTPLNPWSIHSCLGDDNKVWCEVYRSAEKNGAIFCLKDFNETILVAHARTNLAFIHALQYFANIVSTSRYAADIFENMDDFDDDK